MSPMRAPVSAQRAASRLESAGETGQAVARDLRQLAAESLTDALESIPTLWGRFAKLSSALNFARQRYRSMGLTAYIGESEASELIAEEHHRLLRRWLVQPIAYRVADMTVYYRHAGKTAYERMRALVAEYCVETLLPPEAPDMQKQHFLSDLNCIVPLVAWKLDG